MSEIEYTFFLSLVASLGTWVGFVFTPFVSPTLDIFFPLENGTRERVWPIHADYIIIDRDIHFYTVSLHTAFVNLLMSCLFIGQDSVFAIVIEHICGQMSIVR